MWWRLYSAAIERGCLADLDTMPYYLKVMLVAVHEIKVELADMRDDNLPPLPKPKPKARK